MNNVEYFDNSIKQLDGLLAAGYNILFKAREELLSTTQDVEAKAKLFDWHAQEYQKWAAQVYDVMRLTTDRQYYVVHFMSTPRNAVMMSGLPQVQSNFIIGFESKVKALMEVLTMLEERRSVVIRQEIARQEYDGSNRYWLSYDDVSGRLYLNGNILLASTRLDSPADKLMQQVFASPNRLVEIKDVSTTQVASALRDMNIKGSIKKVFFPRTSGKKVLFRPSITNTEFMTEQLEDINLQKLMRNDEKE